MDDGDCTPRARDDVLDALATRRRTIDERVACVELDGEVDLANADEIEAALLLTLVDAEAVIADAHDLRFIDLCGIRSLVAAHETAAADGRTLVVCCAVDSIVRRLATATGLDAALVLAADLEEALRSVSHLD